MWNELNMHLPLGALLNMPELPPVSLPPCWVLKEWSTIFTSPWDFFSPKSLTPILLVLKLVLLILHIRKQCQVRLDCCWARSSHRIKCKTHLNLRMVNVGHCVTSSPLRRMVQPVPLDLDLCPTSHDKLVVAGTKTKYLWSNWSLNLVGWFLGECFVCLFILLYYSNGSLKEGWLMGKRATLYMGKTPNRKPQTWMWWAAELVREGSNILIIL